MKKGMAADDICQFAAVSIANWPWVGAQTGVLGRSEVRFQRWEDLADPAPTPVSNVGGGLLAGGYAIRIEDAVNMTEA